VSVFQHYLDTTQARFTDQETNPESLTVMNQINVAMAAAIQIQRNN
jgi:hypothetical protein